MSGHIESPSQSTKKSRFRFGLLDLMLVTTVIGIGIPAWMARQEIPRLESEVKSLREMSSELYVADEQKMVIRSFGQICWKVETWQCYFPPGHSQQLHLATEAFSRDGFPNRYQTVTVPAGRHDIHIVRQDDDQKGFQTRVFIDQKQVLEKYHPPSWLPNFSGSSWNSDTSDETRLFAADDVVRLQSARYSVRHPQSRSSTNPPAEYTSKGSLVWLSPATVLLARVPEFVHPRMNFTSARDWGSREGIRLQSQSTTRRKGLLEVRPSYHATLERWQQSVQAISVRPVFEDGTLGTPPESQWSQFFSSQPQSGLATAFSNDIEPVEEPDRYVYVGSDVTGKISADGRYQSVFAHFEKRLQQDQPIVEFRFDAKHPNRVGIIPHQRPDGEKLTAVKLLTTLDSQYRFRFSELMPDSSDTDSGDLNSKPVSLKTIEQDFDALTGGSMKGMVKIPIQRLPLLAGDDGDGHSKRRVLRLLTDVVNFRKVPVPAGVQRPWNYQGMPIEQSWIVDESSGIELAIRSTTNFPAPPTAASFPGGTPPPGAVPGGPVMGWTELTIPMPATKPVWLEMDRQETFPANK